MVAMGITANMVTLFGLFVNLIATFYFATGHLITGGILILFGGSFDMIDGAVARAQRNLRPSRVHSWTLLLIATRKVFSFSAHSSIFTRWKVC